MSRIALGTVCAGCALIGLQAYLLSRRLTALEKQLLLLAQQSRLRSDVQAVSPRNQPSSRPPARVVSVAASRLLLRKPVSLASIRPSPTQNTAVEGSAIMSSQAKASSEDDRHENNSQCHFDALPPEALLRIFECLPHESAIVCERVCHEWSAVARLLPEWHGWLLRMARITEAAVCLPGAVPPAFGATPANYSRTVGRGVTLEQSAGAAVARLRALRLPPHETCLAACGAGWTVLAMTTATAVRNSTREPVLVAQFSSHDYMLSACPSTRVVYSGDKDGQLRVWDAHSGDLLARIPVTGSITALEAGGALAS
jgi:hypothetical protein